MSSETLLFLKSLLDAQVLQVGSPDFDQAYTMITKAKRELDAALGRQGGDDLDIT